MAKVGSRENYNMKTIKYFFLLIRNHFASQNMCNIYILKLCFHNRIIKIVETYLQHKK